MRLFTAISAVAFLSIGSSVFANAALDGTGVQNCARLTGATLCAPDCARIQEECRASHPYPADRPAGVVFNRLAGYDGRLSTREIANLIHRRVAVMNWHLHGTVLQVSGSHRERVIESTRRVMAVWDLNRDGYLNRNEALRRSAHFYNHFSDDDVGHFYRSPYWDDKKQEYIVPGNQASAPYEKKIQ